MTVLKPVLAFLLLQSLTPSPSRQPAMATASIEGSVVGASGERLPKVVLTLTSISVSARTGPPLQFLSSLPPELASSLFSAIVTDSSGISEKTVTSDAEGKFQFDNLRPGSYRLEASRSGFVTTKFGQKGANGREAPIVLAEGQKLKDVPLAMTPAGTIRGTILDRNGEPISRAIVQALKYRYTESGRGLNVMQSVTTNDLGEYRLFWLSPGDYVVRALPPASTSARSVVTSRMQGDDGVAEETLVPLYYPGTAVSAEAAIVAVHAAETVSGVNIAAQPVPVHKIRGATLNASGQPESMSIALVPKELMRTYRSNEDLRSNRDGTFEITGVASGSYILLGMQGQLPNSSHLAATAVGIIAGMLELTVGNTDVSNVRLSASSGFPLKGRILREGSALQGIPSDDRGISLTSKISLMPGDSAAISRDDTFVFQNVLPGDYQIAGPVITSGHLNEGHIKSVRLNGQELTTDGIPIRNRPEGELTIVISTETGKLQGRVVNGRREPASNATIVVVPEPSLRHRTNLFFEPIPDAMGKFSIDVPPGRYQVYAWEDVEPNAWFDAGFMQTYESHGHMVAIGAGSTETVEIDVIPFVPQ